MRFYIICIVSLLLPFGFVETSVSGTTDSEPIEVGYQDFPYPSGTGGNSAPTGEKPESKLWWNDGFWWGSLWSTAGNAYHIYRLNPTNQTWVDTGVAIDDRLTSRADALWDGQYLYLVSHVFTTSGTPAPENEHGRLYRYSYNPVTKHYTLNPDFPVKVTQGKSETLVLAKDSTGTLWVAYIEERKVMVNHSHNGNDRNWDNPFVLPVTGATNLTTDDIASLIAFNGYVGIMWSNQDTGKIHFAAHQDGAPATTWQTTAAYTPSSDDHINLKSLQSDGTGSLFAVVKTSQSFPLIVVLVCNSGANCLSASHWSAYPVYEGAANVPTRPILLIDTDDRILYVFVQARENGHYAIYYKSTSLDNIMFPSGIGEPFIKSVTDGEINNPTSTKQNVNSTTGLVILASSSGTNYYYHNSLGDISSPGYNLYLPLTSHSP